jgi:MFS superfamily sulfate permease-like transporter
MSDKKSHGKGMFSPSNLKYDLKAGLIVFLVALPLCLGIALAQKVNLFSGLLAGIIGGIVVSSISGSKLSVSGPAAGLTTIVLGAIASLRPSMESLGYREGMIPSDAAKHGLTIPQFMEKIEAHQSQVGFTYFLAALCIAGVFQIIFGIIRAGIIGHYFPTAVIKGMLSAIGIILILKQFPHLVGFDEDTEGNFEFLSSVKGQNTFTEILHAVNKPTVGPLVIGVVSILFLVFWGSKFIKKHKFLAAIPGPLIIVGLGIFMNFMFMKFAPDLNVRAEHLVNMPDVGSWEKLKGALQFPDFGALSNQHVWVVGLMLAMVASLESLLGVEAVDKLDPEHHVTPTNRELIAQGAGNLICGLIGGVPITSVIVRSSANVSSGAKTQMSSIFHGVLLLAAVFLIPHVLELIPLSSLAAILIVTGFRLAKPALFVNTFKSGWDQFIPFIVTLGVMLGTDLLKGVGAGIFISILFILRQNYKNPFRLLEDTIDGKKHYFIRLSQYVTFVNKGKFIEFFKDVEDGSHIEIDGGRSAFIDRDVLEVITEFKYAAKLRNIQVVLEGIEEVEILSGH